MAESRIVVKMTEIEPVRQALDEAARQITAERERADGLAGQVERLRALLGTTLDWLSNYQCDDEEEGDDLSALEQQIYAALNDVTTPALASAGKGATNGTE